MRPATTATIAGLPTKYVSLVVLVVQNSALVLTMRYSRIQPGPQYLASTAVVMSEIIKCIICILVHLHQVHTKPKDPSLPLLSEETTTSTSYSLTQLCSDVFSVKSGFFKLLVPAVLYTIQNNLQFVAAENLDAATFQVTYQCKILATALFAVILLRQSISAFKWLSLFILTTGVACVQIPSSAPTVVQQGNYTIGIIAVAVACLCSGFAGVYFEKVLKTSSNSNSTSLWVRNIQLSVGCLAIAVTGTLAWDGQAIRNYGFFQGYRTSTVVTICIQAAGGLIVALVIKYADNILKGFATSLSVILSTIVSVFVFDFVITIYFLIGSVLVFTATYMYGLPDKNTSTTTSVATKDMEEAKSDEAMPMINVQDFDQQDAEKVPFRDDVESRGEYAGSASENTLESRPVDPKQQRKVYDELGYVD
jgi:solute carrier family 35 (UDP-sugar transporter), member A1/2/3